MNGLINNLDSNGVMRILWVLVGSMWVSCMYPVCMVCMYDTVCSMYVSIVSTVSYVSCMYVVLLF